MFNKCEMEKESKNFRMCYYSYMQMQLKNSYPFFIGCCKKSY